MSPPILITALVVTLGTAMPSSPSDSLWLHTAAAVVRAAPVCAEYWPGFWSFEQEFMLTRKSDEGMLLVTTGPVPPGWQPLLGDSVPRELLGRSYVRYGFPGQFRGFHISHTLGDRTLPAVPAEYYSVENNVLVLIHEAFHAYQHEAFARAAPMPATLLNTADLDLPEHFARAEVERRILAQVLQTPGELERARLLERYLTTRDLRMRSLPELRSREQWEERVEGTAEWVGLSCAAAAVHAPEDHVRLALLRGLADPKVPLVGGRHVKFRAYAVGAALATVLENLDVTWRQRVVEGVALDELLAEALGWNSTGLDTDADRQWREEYGFSELLMEFGEGAPKPSGS